VPGIDVCLSAHTHNQLERPARSGDTLVIQSGCHGSFLGRLDLELEGGKPVNYDHRRIEVAANIPADPGIADLVRQALAPFHVELAEVVGETATPLTRGTMLEAPMDTLLLAALRHSTGAPIAFTNGWRSGRSAHPPGPPTGSARPAESWGLAPTR
jgi:2',3'-cyclic-nucleotide 2'-phosphodiesterase (5'-nucleotidase family)